jgi:hypothetical protein
MRQTGALSVRKVRRSVAEVRDMARVRGLVADLQAAKR